MNKNVLVDFSIFRPKLILGLVALVTLEKVRAMSRAPITVARPGA